VNEITKDIASPCIYRKFLIKKKKRRRRRKKKKKKRKEKKKKKLKLEYIN